MTPRLGHGLLTLCVLLCLHSAAGAASLIERVRAQAGTKGSVYVVDADDRVLLNVRGEREFIPASVMKVVTTLLAAEHLGLQWRFPTEVYLDGTTLVIKGFGDPYLISEELDRMVAALKPRLAGKNLSGIAIDDSFFAERIPIPGMSGSRQPYDAPVAATAVNFNTINVVRRGGVIYSAEPQTPLTPLARELAKERRVKKNERINIGGRPNDVRRYAAELIAAKLRQAGVMVGEHIGARRAPAGKPLYVHRNSRTLEDMCRDMLFHSNNFIANQIFLALGAKSEGEPATLDKSIRVARKTLAAHPGTKGLVVTEGAGLSYDNRATGPAFAAVLKAFAPYRELLRVQHGIASKTGTLRVTTTLAGYIDSAKHGTVRFVIRLAGGTGDRRWRIARLLRDHL